MLRGCSEELIDKRDAKNDRTAQVLPKQLWIVGFAAMTIDVILALIRDLWKGFARSVSRRPPSAGLLV